MNFADTMPRINGLRSSLLQRLRPGFSTRGKGDVRIFTTIMTTRFSPLLMLAAAFMLFAFSRANAQSATSGFRQLSRPEKFWVVVHPFVAKKAWRCTQKARTVTDSLEKAGQLADGNGGQLDAFRHTYWMALLVQEIAPRKAEKLGRAHEKGNYLDYKRGKNEEGTRADSIACMMDLANNKSGILIGTMYKNDTAMQGQSLVEVVLHLDWDGKLTIVKKNENGQPVTCEGKTIDPARYKNRWYIPKCLTASNDIVVKH